ncbi:MAG: hypothetical protein WCP11_03210 [Candidatus Saccharibacteria bacterium]
MSDRTYDELAVERAIKERFGIDADIRQAVLFRAPVGPLVEATLFLTSKKQLFLYVVGKSRLVFSDIKKIVFAMGLKADTYMPPKGRPDYFNEVGRAKFCEVFPGRKNVTDEDLIFYKTLAPYNPALVLISEVRDGYVYQYDSDSNTKWRVGAKFAYRRIKTS